MSKDNNMTLWEIDQSIAYLLDNLCDEDGVADEEALAKLQELELAQPVKREACALFIKNRRAMASAVRAEEMALAVRRHRYEKDAERVERILAQSLNGERFETPKVCVKWRKSQAVEIADGVDMFWGDELVDRFCVFSHRIDKQAVAEALKRGEEVPGAQLVERNNMIIEGVRK